MSDLPFPSGRAMPPLPMDEVGPVFREPWEAQAFALVLSLYRARHFTWPEWVEALSTEIAAAKARGEPDLGDTYYRHWLTALENLTVAKNLAGRQELTERKAELEAHPPHQDHEAHRAPVAIG